MYRLIHGAPQESCQQAGAVAAASVAICAPLVGAVITAVGGTSAGSGSSVALCSAASLLIADSELPIRPTIAVSWASESFKRFRTRRTWVKSVRSSLLRIG